MDCLLKMYSDAGLTSEVTDLKALQMADGSAPPALRTVYIGGPDGYTWKDATDPGTGQITLSIADTGAPGLEPTVVKLALHSVGTGSAVGGDPLELGTTIEGGVAGAIAVDIEVDTDVTLGNVYVNLSLAMTDLLQIPG